MQDAFGRLLSELPNLWTACVVLRLRSLLVIAVIGLQVHTCSDLLEFSQQDCTVVGVVGKNNQMNPFHAHFYSGVSCVIRLMCL